MCLTVLCCVWPAPLPQVLASQAVVEQLMENRYLALQRLMAFMVGHVVRAWNDACKGLQ